MTPIAKPQTAFRPRTCDAASSAQWRAAACASFSTVLAALVLMAPPAVAQTAPPAGTDSQTEAAAASPQTPLANGPRFTFAPAAGGALRLDTQTGTVSLCANSPTGYACTLLPDDRKAYEDQITQLREELAALRGQPGAAEKDEQQLPDDNLSGDVPLDPDDINAAFDYAERTLRWLRGLITGAPHKSAEESL